MRLQAQNVSNFLDEVTFSNGTHFLRERKFLRAILASVYLLAGFEPALYSTLEVTLDNGISIF